MDYLNFYDTMICPIMRMTGVKFSWSLSPLSRAPDRTTNNTPCLIRHSPLPGHQG